MDDLQRLEVVLSGLQVQDRPQVDRLLPRGVHLQRRVGHDHDQPDHQQDRHDHPHPYHLNHHSGVEFVHPVSPGGSVKFVASGVNFSIFTNLLCFFLLKLLTIGEIDGVKFLA